MSCLCRVVIAVLMFAACSVQTGYAGVTRTIRFVTDEGTAMNVDVSPDGREIVFDLLGDIYTLPIGGGKARLLIGGANWDVAPRFDPRGARIVFVSDREQGVEGLWIADRHGRNPELLVSGGLQRLHTPIWSQDGSTIIVGWGRDMAVIDVHRKTIEKVATGYGETFVGSLGSLSPDARYAYFGNRRLIEVDRTTGEQTLLTAAAVDDLPAPIEYQPIVSHSGRWLSYVRYLRDGSTELRLRSLRSADERPLLNLIDGDTPGRGAEDDEETRPAYAFTPDDSAIVMALNGKICWLPLDGGACRIIPFQAHVRQLITVPVQPRRPNLTSVEVPLRALRAPVLAPDGKRVVFTAVGQLWVHDLQHHRTHRLTASTDREYAAAISPDGHWVAYLAFTDSMQAIDGVPVSRSRVMVAALMPGKENSGKSRILTPESGQYSPPLWFGDSHRVLTTVAEPQSTRRRPVQTFVWMDIDRPSLVKAGRAPDLGDENSRLRAMVGPDDRLYWIESDREIPGMKLQDTFIRSVALDGSDQHTHLTINKQIIDVAAIAPDGHHLLFAPKTLEGVFITRVPSRAEAPMSILRGNEAIRKISADLASGISWQNQTRALYTLGPRLVIVDVPTKGVRDVIDVDFSLPRAHPAGTVAIRGARLVTMAGRPGQEQVIEHGTLLMEHGILTAVGPSSAIPIPKAAMIINGTGLTLVPGLIDVHLHDGASLSSSPKVHPDDVSELAYGITSRYDPSTSEGDADLERQETIATGGSFGPRYYFSGRPLGGYAQVADLAAARRIMSLYGALGVVEFKEYNFDTRRKRQLLVQAAREQGLGITAHVGGLNHSMTLAVDGFTAFEHSGFAMPVFNDVITLLVESGINWTPTLNISYPLDGISQGRVHFSREQRRERREELIKLSRFVWSEHYRDYFEGEVSLPFDKLHAGHASKAAASALKAGALVSIGAHNPPGLFSHWEMRALVEGGATPIEALRAATINGAKKIGIDHAVGTLERGKLADAVVLAANPLEDIRNTAKIRYVIANGVIYDGETLTRLWPDYVPLPRMAWQSEQQYDALRPADPLVPAAR